MLHWTSENINRVMINCVSHGNLMCNKSSFFCFHPPIHHPTYLQYLTNWPKHSFEALGVIYHTSTSHDVVLSNQWLLGPQLSLEYTFIGVRKTQSSHFQITQVPHTFIHLLVTIPSLYHTYLLPFYSPLLHVRYVGCKVARSTLPLEACSKAWCDINKNRGEKSDLLFGNYGYRKGKYVDLLHKRSSCGLSRR